MEKIDFLSSSNSGDSKLLLACANGVPYAIRLCTNCCSTTATSYINLATGVSSSTPPSGLSIGECADVVCPPVYETESFVATAGQTSFSLSHAPYKDVDFTRNGATLIDSVATVNGNTVTYVPSENNNINLLAGDDITISYLYLDPSCTEFSINSVICFEFTEGATTTNIKVVSVNNAVTYYENDVKITDATRITEVEQLVVNATADNVVCCPDCGGGTDPDIPPYKTCYKIGETTPSTKTTFGPYLTTKVGEARYIKELKLQINSPFSTYQTFDFSANPIQYWDGENFVEFQVVYDALEAAGYFTAVETLLGCSGLVHLVRTIGLTMFVSTYHPDETCNTAINANFVAVKAQNTAGTVVLDADSISGTISFVDTFNGSPFEVVYADGISTFYENGLVVTDPTRLAEMQAIVDANDINSFVCCDECDESKGDLIIDLAMQDCTLVLTYQSSNGTQGVKTADISTCKPDIPAYQQCYPVATDEQTSYASWENVLFSFFNNQPTKFPPGTPVSISQVKAGSLTQTLDNPVQIWDGTKFGTPSAIQTALESAGFFSKLLLMEPTATGYKVTGPADGSAMYIRVWNEASATIGLANVSIGYQINPAPSGTIGYNTTPTSGNFTITETINTEYKVKYFNGDTYYYKDGVLLTVQQDIDDAIAAINNLDALGCCSECSSTSDGSETKVQAGTGTTITGTGTEADPYIINSTGTLENVYFSTTDPNTAGTTFSPNSPSDINKLYISDVDGSTWIWNGTAYVSKTDNLGWQAIGRFGTMSTGGGQAVGAGTVVDWTNTVQTYGTLVVPSPATNTLLLKAGYIYEVDAELQMTFANSSTWWNYALYSGTTAATQTTQFGTAGKIRPQNEAVSARYDTNAQGFVVATVDTYVSVKGTNGSGTVNGFEGANYFKAKVIGVI